MYLSKQELYTGQEEMHCLGLRSPGDPCLTHAHILVKGQLFWQLKILPDSVCFSLIKSTDTGQKLPKFLATDNSRYIYNSFRGFPLHVAGRASTALQGTASVFEGWRWALLLQSIHGERREPPGVSESPTCPCMTHACI